MLCAPPFASPLERVNYRNSDRMRLRRLVGDRQSLDAELLLDLQRLQLRAFLRHVGIDEIADTGGQRVGQFLGEGRLDRELRRAGRQLGERRVDVGQRGLDAC